MWKKNHDIKADERFCWKEKLSTISRAYIHETEVGVPKVEPDRLPFHNKPPMQIERIPYPSKSPFARWSEPSQEQILTSLDESTVVIYTDGSTKPEPGLGGAGLVIQDSSLSQWLGLEFPIKGITTNIASEIEAVRQALIYVLEHYIGPETRIVVLSDCKFVVNAILDRWNSETYNLPIAECQRK